MTVDEQRGKDETFDASSPTPCQIPPKKAVTERGSGLIAPKKLSNCQVPANNKQRNKRIAKRLSKQKNSRVAMDDHQLEIRTGQTTTNQPIPAHHVSNWNSIGNNDIHA